ncbi:hypothetical protein HHK36_023378 [Tetracentron sinense]|uniref:Uncharacterized protein n=1 Tax=Tetracentron sinense TaxID=13715 RepID=A0A835D5C5_TETSI|nr:hypothetical protein HHK36_023378 [Tetracentron sinense]
MSDSMMSKGRTTDRCAIPKLNKEIVPEKSKVVVKPSKVIITVFKASKRDCLDLHFKEDKQDLKDCSVGSKGRSKSQNFVHQEVEDDALKISTKQWVVKRFAPNEEVSNSVNPILIPPSGNSSISKSNQNNGAAESSSMPPVQVNIGYHSIEPLVAMTTDRNSNQIQVLDQIQGNTILSNEGIPSGSIVTEDRNDRIADQNK